MKNHSVVAVRNELAHTGFLVLQLLLTLELDPHARGECEKPHNTDD